MAQLSREPKRSPLQPDTSYFICGTPRSGSFLLCEALKNTRLAGMPEEYFWRGDEPAWRERWGVSTYAEYVAAAIRQGTTGNGVFGAKVMWGYWGDFTGKLCTVEGNESLPVPEMLARTFPGLRYIHMTRRDRVRQSVSFSKAIQTGSWASYGEEPQEPQREPDFGFEQIDHLVREVDAHDAAWRGYFAEAGVEPLMVVYEDLVPAYEQTARRVLDYLGIAAPRNLKFGERRMTRQADGVSEEWVRRYCAMRQDRQGGGDA